MEKDNQVIPRLFTLLIRLGVGLDIQVDYKQFEHVTHNDWQLVQALAEYQGLSAIVLDGIELFPEAQRPPKEFLLEWIGSVLRGESTYKHQKEVAIDMSNLFHRNYIRTYVLKGFTISECYPIPHHRLSSDMDCFLSPDKGDFDVWSLGNDLIRSKGFRVDTDFYKNSTFDLPCLIVENHKYLTPFRGNKKLTSFESVLQTLISRDKGEDIFENSWLYRPPVMVSALFLVEHAYSHFLHEGLTWRMVLDWMLFRKKHEDEINWVEFEVFVDEFGFRRFYDAYSHLGCFLLGNLKTEELTKSEKRMLNDIWAPLDLHETTRGLKGKLALAGNTWRARWKYRCFTDISWITALWIQTKGFLFMKHPTIN